MKAVYKKVECPECHKSIDVRGFRSHSFKHKREADLLASIPNGLRLVQRTGNSVQLFANLKKEEPYSVDATSFVEGFRAGYQSAWHDAHSEEGENGESKTA